MGRLAHAFYAQTGPYQQGARLTSLELQSQNIPSTMVCDTMMASLLSGNSQGRNIHAFILGADRIAANGDTANKISSYQIALLARHVPPPKGKQRARVLVCAPVATFDLGMDTGEHIVIEERPQWEACTVRGKVYHHSPQAKSATSEATQLSAKQADGHAHIFSSSASTTNGVSQEQEKSDVVTVLVTPEGTQAWNPAFDVTPASLIDGVACELGVAEKGERDAFDLRTYVKENGPPKPSAKEWKDAEAAGGANGVVDETKH
jgi:methylthioribose-1-phosphate isomerase